MVERGSGNADRGESQIRVENGGKNRNLALNRVSFVLFDPGIEAKSSGYSRFSNDGTPEALGSIT